ncbi:MAG: hypothetical protein GWN31_05905 [Candidatus Thorarchaeota archaeon]|nr:hypothetical protein [Candidatus Thorarchaeota archaeon]NIW51571.1 hypothetical protein [Candidatus Korarchaeota archaeon]
MNGIGTTGLLSQGSLNFMRKPLWTMNIQRWGKVWISGLGFGDYSQRSGFINLEVDKLKVDGK